MTKIVSNDDSCLCRTARIPSQNPALAHRRIDSKALIFFDEVTLGSTLWRSKCDTV